MKVLIVFTIILIVLFKSIYCKETTNSTFVATNEWQEIPPGVAIPPGLHVRINLETRKKEAKLLNQTEHKDTNNAIAIKPDHELNQPNENQDEKKTLLSDALKSIQSERLHLKFSAEELSQIKREYKAKQDPSAHENKFNHFQLDSEVISFLIEDFLNLTQLDSLKEITADECIQRKMYILDNFEHMLHQIDNSIHFAISQGGLELLLPIVANESLPLRIKAIRVLGVLTQNNPIVQREVFNKNFGTYLLKIMLSSVNSEELSTTLFSFGSLIRKFPQAQKALLSSSGTQTLIAIMNKKIELKVKVKVINLLSDLLEEHKEMSTLDQHTDAELNEYYKESELIDWLNTNSYCESIASVVIQDALEFLKHPDLTEDYVLALKISHDICRDLWANKNEFKISLLTLKNHLKLDSNEYYQEVADEVSKILTQLNISKHEEL